MKGAGFGFLRVQFEQEIQMTKYRSREFSGAVSKT
jgi:hypothetical protein